MLKPLRPLFAALLFAAPAAAEPATPRLHVEGARVYDDQGRLWAGRGANLHDPRSCWQHVGLDPQAAQGEVLRHVDELVDVWGADFIRLVLESHAVEQDLLHDPVYAAQIRAIVDHIGSKPETYVLISVWVDPSIDPEDGAPTKATHAVLRELVRLFPDAPHVMLGVANEPTRNWDGARDAEIWARMDAAVAAIRDEEDKLGAPRRLVAVQGTRAWGRRLNYYIERPIEAGGGVGVLYETHVYDPQSAFERHWIAPSETLPVVIGEFGPVSGDGLEMSLEDAAALMATAEAYGVPYAAWNFHWRCPPNLLVDHGVPNQWDAHVGLSMALEPSEWGRLLKDRLSQPPTRLKRAVP